jgi:hypothetical protein
MSTQDEEKKDPMATDDTDDKWIDEIHQKRKSLRDAADATTRERLEKEQIFETKLPALWAALDHELRRVVDVYNAQAGDAQVKVGTESPEYQFQRDRSRETGIRGAHGEGSAQPAQRRLVAQSLGNTYTYDLILDQAEIVVRAYDLKTLAKRILHPFFENIA